MSMLTAIENIKVEIGVVTENGILGYKKADFEISWS